MVDLLRCGLRNDLRKSGCAVLENFKMYLF